jgi:D-psicose/D-tagatose/L-ribulose 3-epimerase
MYWARTWSDDQLPFFARARQAGFDAVEISLINGGDFDIEPYREALNQFGCKPNCIMGLTPETDITSPDQSIRTAGIGYLKRALEAAGKLGSPILCGLPYVQWLYFPDEGDFQPYRDRCANALREVATVAADNGVTICLEVINRFETFIFNTVIEALVFLQQVDHPAVKLHLDTYHMNMEEDNVADAIRAAGHQLGHFHCVASNRKLPGKGQLNWYEIRQALDDIGYDGGLGIEAFPLPNTETGRMVHTWRPLVNDLDADARQAAAFIRQRLIDPLPNKRG